MDRLYRDLNGVTGKDKAESIHLTDYPESKTQYIDKALESKMEKAQNISSLVLSLRKKEMIKVRQPLQKILIPTLSEAEKAEILAVANLIKHEVNVKEIEFIDDASGILVKQSKPNFRTVGPKYGKQMKDIAAVINGLTQQDIQAFERQGTKEITLDGEKLTLTLDDVEITSQDIEGWLVASSSTGLVVALDATITDELRAEGIARELVNRIQNIRKDNDYEITDRIKIDIEHPNFDLAIYKEEIKDMYVKDYIDELRSSESIRNIRDFDALDDEVNQLRFFKNAIDEQKEYISREVLSDEISVFSLGNAPKEEYEDIEIDNLKLKIKLEKSN